MKMVEVGFDAGHLSRFEFRLSWGVRLSVPASVHAPCNPRPKTRINDSEEEPPLRRLTRGGASQHWPYAAPILRRTHKIVSTSGFAGLSPGARDLLDFLMMVFFSLFSTTMIFMFEYVN
jgi:hypothetical protein